MNAFTELYKRWKFYFPSFWFVSHVEVIVILSYQFEPKGLRCLRKTIDSWELCGSFQINCIDTMHVSKSLHLLRSSHSIIRLPSSKLLVKTPLPKSLLSCVPP